MMTFDPNQPYKNVDGVDVNLTSDEIIELAAQQSTYTAQSAITSMNAASAAALAESDKTMLRIQEAISLGLTTPTTADVIAWVNYRKNLRILVTSNVAQSLPNKPAYPQNT